MASKASIALFLTLNVLFFSMVSSNYVPVVPGVPVPVLPGVPSVPSQKGTCPIDALKLGVCANVLNLVKVKVGSPPTLPCCSVINGLADLEAAVCLCTALKANVLGINLDIPVSLSIILNNCGRKNCSFQCP